MADFDLTGTFWSGACEGDTEALEADLPLIGKVLDVTRPALERWRVFQNAYYDLYNNGFGNFTDEYLNEKAETSRYEAFTDAVRHIEHPIPVGFTRYIDDYRDEVDREANQYPSMFDDGYWSQDDVDGLEAIGLVLLSSALDERKRANATKAQTLAERVAEIHYRPSDAEAINDVITRITEVEATLRHIVRVGGNLSDDVIENVGGIHEGRSRGIMVVTARQLANSALTKLGCAEEKL